MPTPSSNTGPMDVMTGLAATVLGGWLVACTAGSRTTAVTATALVTGILLAAYRTAPARRFPTAEAVADHVNLQGKVAVVTGATSGIGVQTARVLAQRGAHVYLAGRNAQKLQQTREGLLRSLPQGTRVSTLLCDLNDLNSVRQAAHTFLQMESRLHVLVNNAGIMALPNRTATAQDLEAQVGVCHVAHFLLTQSLLPALQNAAVDAGNNNNNATPPRVVVLSSSAYSGHELPTCVAHDRLETQPYNPWTAYGNAKAANILFAKGFNDRYGKGDAPIYAFSVMVSDPTKEKHRIII